jgi:hypothetical protein
MTFFSFLSFNLAIGDVMLNKLSLQERRAIQGTSKSFKNSGTVAANAEQYQDYESVAELRKFLPLDSVVIVNNSSQDIEFYPNDDSRFLKRVTSKTIVKISKDDIGGLVRHKWVNVGSGSINANEVEVFVQKERPNTQSVVDTLVKKWPRLFT